MRIYYHGNKKSEGSTILFSIGLVFAFSIIMVGLVSWLNTRYETVKKEFTSFYSNECIVDSNGAAIENF